MGWAVPKGSGLLSLGPKLVPQLLSASLMRIWWLPLASVWVSSTVPLSSAIGAATG